MKRLLGRELSTTGLMVGVIFLGLSLTPSLLPRPWLFQGIVSGLALVTGYGVGVAAITVWRYLELPTWEDSPRRTAQIVCAVAGTAWLVFFLAKTGNWQNRVRELVGEPPGSSTNPIRILITAVLVAYVVLIGARLVAAATRRTVAWLQRYVPPRVGRVVGFATIALLLYTVVSGVLLAGSVNLANSMFAIQDDSNDEGIERPTSELRSGSSESLVPWEDLGRQGRKFVGTGPSTADLAGFIDEPLEPIRAYVGLKAGDTPEERAELALEELLRTDAFDRSVMVVATSTGTGWLDPNAVDPLEYIHGGDTAIVSMQYSYLPSWISLLVDQVAAKESAQALFDAVHGHWETLDESDRPDLYVYGLSLGAYGSETSANRVSLANDPIDGGLWVGPPFVSEYWADTTDNRDPGSPAWRPLFGDGQVIRFANEPGDLELPDSEWADNRYIYLQYPTDPVTFVRPDSMFSEPDWLKGEPGPGVTPDFHWYPFVTFWQLLIDLPRAGEVQHGFGHNYSVESYVDAWVSLTEPEDWTDTNSEQVIETVTAANGS